VNKLPNTATKTDISKFLKQNPNWAVNSAGTKMVNTFTFANHVTALVFIARVTVHAEILNHHPDITFTYAKVKINLTTHSIKALSKLDFDLARRIDLLKK